MGGRGDRDVSPSGADGRRERDILDVLRALGEGEVTTYGDVADVAGHPRQARLVGRILATTDHEVPWWRVVAATGHLVSGEPDVQTRLLRSEGVEVRDGRVVGAPIGRFSPRRERRPPTAP
jgi:methylated-DNA-protein-cysteine methyltransferase related protein